MIILRRPAATTSIGSVIAEDMAGTKNGSNYTYTTVYSYLDNRIQLSYNGQILTSPYDFTESGDKEVQLTYIKPEATDLLSASYEATLPFTTNSNVTVADDLTGTKNGINQVFTTTYTYLSDKIYISYNGQLLSSPDDFTETDDKEITFKYITPESTDIIKATYERPLLTVVGVQTSLNLTYVSVRTWQSSTTGFLIVPEDLQVYRNGVKQKITTDYAASLDGSAIKVIFTYDTDNNDWVNIVYSGT